MQKITKKSLLLLIITIILTVSLIVSSCKVSEKTAAETPALAAQETPASSEEQEMVDGLNELDELDTLEQDLDEDLGLDELDKLSID